MEEGVMSWFKVIKLSAKQKVIASKAGDKKKIDAEDFTTYTYIQN